MGGACTAVCAQRPFMLPVWVEPGIFGLLGGAQSSHRSPAEHHGRALVIERLIDRRLGRAETAALRSYAEDDTVVFHRDAYGCRRARPTLRWRREHGARTSGVRGLAVHRTHVRS